MVGSVIVRRQTAGDLREANRQQAACGRHPVQVGGTLDLRKVVVEKPRLTLECRCHVGVERLVAVDEDRPIEMQELEGVQRHAREGRRPRRLAVRVPAQAPIRALHRMASNRKHLS